MSAVDIESRILSTPPIAPPTTKAQQAQPNAPRFDKALAAATAQNTAHTSGLQSSGAQAGIKFSGHAQTRLASRQITLTDSDIARLGEAVTRAAAKGARESLVLTDKAALVVSVPNRTVITAVARADLKENIFTNIDSAVLL